jgi:hypothetical protein
MFAQPPGEGVLAALRANGATKTKLVTLDLDEPLALDMARGGQTFALVIDRAYDVGRAMARSAAYGLLGKRAPPFVIVPALTFSATPYAAMAAGALPVFCDVLPGTLTIDPDQVEAAVTARTRAIMPVHLGHQMADMDRIAEIARRHGAEVDHARRADGLARRPRPDSPGRARGAGGRPPRRRQGASPPRPRRRSPPWA